RRNVSSLRRRHPFLFARKRATGRMLARRGADGAGSMPALAHVVRVRNTTRGSTLARAAEVAPSPLGRFLGLMGRRAWADTDGLLIRPGNSIHRHAGAMVGQEGPPGLARRAIRGMPAVAPDRAVADD